MSAPLPVRPRAIKASRIAACAVAPSRHRRSTCRPATAPLGRRYRGEPALGLDQEIVGLALRIGPRRRSPKWCSKSAKDSSFFSRSSENELVHRAGFSGFARTRRRSRSAVPATDDLLGGKVDPPPNSAAVEPDEIAALPLARRHSRGEIALRPFHLDDMRAASASRELQNGAATACSTAMTINPSSGSMVLSQ